MVVKKPLNTILARARRRAAACPRGAHPSGATAGLIAGPRLRGATRMEDDSESAVRLAQTAVGVVIAGMARRIVSVAPRRAVEPVCVGRHYAAAAEAAPSGGAAAAGRRSRSGTQCRDSQPRAGRSGSTGTKGA
jgi:hypothetical protein